MGVDKVGVIKQNSPGLIKAPGWFGLRVYGSAEIVVVVGCSRAG